VQEEDFVRRGDQEDTKTTCSAIIAICSSSYIPCTRSGVCCDSLWLRPGRHISTVDCSNILITLDFKR
jgi:hypothetical protein